MACPDITIPFYAGEAFGHNTTGYLHGALARFEYEYWNVYVSMERTCSFKKHLYLWNDQII